MNLLPNKHLPLEDSLLGMGPAVVDLLDSPKTLTQLWEDVKSTSLIKNFDRLVLVLVLLYSLDAVAIRDGLVFRQSLQ